MKKPNPKKAGSNDAKVAAMAVSALFGSLALGGVAGYKAGSAVRKKTDSKTLGFLAGFAAFSLATRTSLAASAIILKQVTGEDPIQDAKDAAKAKQAGAADLKKDMDALRKFAKDMKELGERIKDLPPEDQKAEVEKFMKQMEKDAKGDKGQDADAAADKDNSASAEQPSSEPKAKKTPRNNGPK